MLLHSSLCDLFGVLITIIFRFVEEQEPYGTGSENENENVFNTCLLSTKKTPEKSWIPSWWFTKKA